MIVNKRALINMGINVSPTDPLRGPRAPRARVAEIDCGPARDVSGPDICFPSQSSASLISR